MLLKNMHQKKEYVAVKDSDVDNIDYFPYNVGDAKEVIEKDFRGTPTFKEVFKYNKDGGGTSEIMRYKVETGEWY